MSKRIRIGLICAIIAQALFSFATPGVASASTEALAQPRAIDPALARYLRPMPLRQPVDSNPGAPRADTPRDNVGSNRPAPLRQEVTPTLRIVSTPWGTLDNDHPSTEGPHAFVVEAVITNTSPITTIENLEIVLDYDEDPISRWELLPGENEIRTLDSLAPGEVHHAYWFARYSSVPRTGHQYTVTVRADHANPVATSRNYYEDLGGDTIRTRGVQDTGSSGLASASAEIIVGVAFTVTTEYDLGQSASRLLFSPTGDPDLNAGAYRLLSSAVALYNDAGTQNAIYNDRLYIETLPDFAENALITYTFIAVRPSDTYLCPYATVAYGKDPTKYTYKYDTHYCDATWNTTIPITGTLSFSLTKEVSSPTIQQNELLTYTIHYTNNGTLPLTYAWVWDQVDTANSSIITHTLGHDADETALDQGRVAWYLGDVPPGASDTFTVTVLVDGDGQDIANGTDVVNQALFGINQGSLPDSAALTSTVSTAVQAPVISISKADGQATAEAGDVLTYTLIVTNSGPVAATGVVVTDVLPAEVVYVSGTASETGRDGQTLTWNNLGATAGTIAPSETVVITIPVTVRSKSLSSTVLANQMAVRYWNPAGWLFTVRTATDTTTVLAPDLGISKQAVDTVLVGRPLTYTLHYANNGLVAATNVVITDEVPSNVNYQTCSGGDSCGESGDVVSWTIGTIPSETSGTVSFRVWVPSSLSTGDLIVNSDYGIVAYGTITDQTDFVPGPPVTTTASRQAGYVNGYTFIDANGDGAYDDATEATLSDITVTLDGPHTPLLTATTSITGFYRFRVEYDDEPISVTAALPASYFRTTPGTVFTYSLYGITQTVNFGYAPIASTFGVIYGTVFHDTNHDGSHDQGENGLPGVEITSTDTLSSPVTTNQLGQYTLRYEISGTVTIAETNPDYYVSTTPDVVHTAAVTGSSGPSPIDFGDFLGVRIMGQVFVDADVDAAKDAGESGLLGATVAANGGMATTTGSTGVYTLYVTVDDTRPITITETDPPGYRSTNAIPGEFMSRVDANRLSINGPISGTVYTGGDFGDVQASDVITISGRVWEDLNPDGQPDGEPGLGGAVVGLSTGMTQTTGSDGAFLLYAPPSTTVQVTETNPTGYASTNAIPGNAATKLDNDTLIASALVSGSISAGNLFGDALIGTVATITGTVFDDETEDGVFDKDGGEVGIPGVTVTLQTNIGVITVRTDLAGNYEFGIAPETNVRITSAGPGGGFYPTTVESVILRPPSPGVYPNNNFGYSDDTDVAVISGLVFDDVDGDGEQEPGELGLPGAVITLTNSGPPITTTTGGSGLITGTFTFSVPAVITDPVVYGLHELNPSGYRSTTLDDVNVEVVSGILAYSVLFGDTDSLVTASIYGNVFEDADGNGLQGPAEPGIPGVVISVTVNEGVLTRTTKSHGQFSYGFRIEEEGDHAVREQDPAKPGYRSTTPDEVILEIVLGNSYLVNFGDVPITATFSTIMGTVFYDVSGDGRQQIGEEPGLEGVDVALYGSGGQQITATKTREYGQYTFPITVTDHIRVAETDLPGFHSTTPNTVTVNVTATGQVYSVDFGDSDYDLTSFFGTVFDDRNVNGARDLTEPALSGVTVTISGTFGVAPPDPYVTNEWGQFTFPIDVTGIFTVTETDLPNFVSTSAIPAHPAVARIDVNTLRATVDVLGMDLGDNLFGDVRASDVITITGYVWDDNGSGRGTAGNGQWDLDEPALPGALVSLSSGLTQTTGADGAFLLYAPPSQVITVTETDPTGYVSTDAVAGTNATKVDSGTLRVSELISGSTSAGNLFGDTLPADLAVAKSGDPGTVVAGTILTYTLVYTNNGPSFAQGITITDVLPPEVTFGGPVSQPAMWSGPTYSPGPPATLTWYTTSTLAAGLPGTIVFTVTANANVPEGTTISNNVGIASNTPDTVPGNDTDDELTGVTAVADLVISKSDRPFSLAAGETLTYTLVANNYGPSDAQNVVVSDTLPAEVTVFSVDPITDSQSGRTLYWNVSTLAQGTTRTYTVVVTVDSGTKGWITNTAEISAATFDPTTPNVDAERTYIGTATDLAISKSADRSRATAGEMLTYTLMVDNNGPSDAPAVVVSDTLPAEVAVVSVDPITDSQSGRTLGWRPGTLVNGASHTYTVVVRVNSDASGAITNLARASSAITESEPLNNTAIEITPVDTQADLAVVKSASSHAVAAGGVLTYTLVYTNHGPSDAQDVTITDSLPPEAMFGGAGEPGTVILPDLIWHIPTLAAGDGGTIVFTVTVRPDATDTITNSVVITTSTLDPDADNNADDEVTTIGVPDLATIYGFVFEDLDGDGAWDGDEMSIQGVTVTLDSAFTETTDASGLYFFVTPVSGTHTVVETDLPGYRSTTPNEVHVEVSLGQTHRADFGDIPLGIADFAVIFGTVFEDLDSNEVWDDDEVGIPDVTITLDGEKQITTNFYGGYTLSTTVTGTHTVVETDLPGYFSTTPNNRPITVTILDTSYEINFGDVPALGCTCLADGYEEDDLAEQAKGLGIGRRQARNFCDDATDWITFTAEAGSMYTVTTSSWGQRADTVMVLFDTDGQTPLAENDDYAGATDFSSRIVWKAPTGGVYYVRVTNRAALTGCSTTYDLRIQPQEPFRVYLPIAMRNYPAHLLYLPIVIRDYGTPTVVARQEVVPQVSNLRPTGIISHTCPDAYEVDDTWEQARVITEAVQIHSFDSDPVMFAADKDFVWFDIADWSTITFTTAQVTDTQTALLPSMISLELYNEYGTALGKAGTGQLVWENATAGRYILGVSPLTTTFGCTTTVGYRLRLETQLAVEGNTFIYLPLVMKPS